MTEQEYQNTIVAKPFKVTTSVCGGVKRFADEESARYYFNQQKRAILAFCTVGPQKILAYKFLR